MNPLAFIKIAIQNSINRTKSLLLQVSDSATVSTQTTLQSSQTADRILTLPDVSGTLVELDAVQTLTNKTLVNTTIDGTLNNIINISADDVVITPITGLPGFTNVQEVLESHESSIEILDATVVTLQSEIDSLALGARTPVLISNATFTISTPGIGVSSLAFDADIFLAINTLNYTDNRIPASASPILLPNAYDVAYVVPNTVPSGPDLNVTVAAAGSVPSNGLIIANRDSSSSITINNARLQIGDLPTKLNTSRPNLTANRSVISDSSGNLISGTTTATEVGYLSGVTSGIQSQLATKASTTLTSAHILVGNGSNVATDVAVNGQATINNAGAVTLDNSAVISKVLTGYTSGSGSVSASDSILSAVQKLNGNDDLKVSKTGDTMSGDLLFNTTKGIQSTAAAQTLNIGTNFDGSIVLGTASTFPTSIVQTLSTLVSNIIRVSGEIQILAAQKIRFFDSTSTNNISFQAPATVPATTVFILPNSDGSPDQILKTNGAGSLGWTANNGTATPSGIIIDFAGSTAPTGYLICNGQAISRTTFADLFAVTGTTYGAGDGSTTFNVPDCRGRVNAGLDVLVNGTYANRMTIPINSQTLGAAGGSQIHQLTENETPMVTHGHTVPNGINSNNNAGTVQPAIALDANRTAIATSSVSDAILGRLVSQHNNTQPTIILNKIIKT